MSNDNPSGPMYVSLHEAGYLQGMLDERSRGGDVVAKQLWEKFGRHAKVLVSMQDGSYYCKQCPHALHLHDKDGCGCGCNFVPITT